MTTDLEAADLRQWWREAKDRIWGYVYADPGGLWDDGDLGCFDVTELVDCGLFYVLHTKGRTIFKLSKSEEKTK